jgi:predicted nuclease of predicted toxin-antitoxin system
MSTWQFLLDENIDPKTATYLHKEDVRAEPVRDALWQGADDMDDILPYAQDHDLVIVTSDVTDFATLPVDTHAGIVLLYDDTMPAYRVASGLLAMVEAYPSRDAFTGREELDPWV